MGGVVARLILFTLVHETLIKPKQEELEFMQQILRNPEVLNSLGGSTLNSELLLNRSELLLNRQNSEELRNAEELLNALEEQNADALNDALRNAEERNAEEELRNALEEQNADALNDALNKALEESIAESIATAATNTVDVALATQLAMADPITGTGPWPIASSPNPDVGNGSDGGPDMPDMPDVPDISFFF